MKNAFFLTIACLGFACRTQPDAAAPFQVGYQGALKNMMHQGDISAKADLADFQGTAHFYALGAAENLKGEIQIFDSAPLNTRVADGQLVFEPTFQPKAALLVYASVPQWQSVPIPADIPSYAELETFIEQAAAELGINVSEPFPFLIEGSPASFDWHVIDWKEGDKEHSHEKHKNSGLHGTEINRSVEILGFYSNAHHAIFTHHSTNMHLHFTTTDHTLAGHLDDLIPGTDMVLKLPVTE